MTATHLPTVARRAFLRVGGLVAAGACTGWPGLRPAAAGAAARPGAARSCILIYLLGGPPHLDMWDLKPAAPPEVRGPFRPVATCVPGVQVCEHLPRLARAADKFALLRAVSHPNNNHTPMIYYTLTGHHVENRDMDNNLTPPQRTDFPHIGAAVARLKPPAGPVPGFVALPEVAVRANVSNARPAVPLRGGRAGFLGASFDPLIVNDDPRTPEAQPGLSLPPDVTPGRFAERRGLLEVLESRAVGGAAARGSDELRNMAVHLTGAAGGTGAAAAFALDREPAALRDRYGRHRFGQSLLLARRLAEAGVPLIAVHFNNMTRCDGWDTHAKNFDALKDELLPLVDQGLSALLEDLDQRGRLGETAVACLGEFGRTPKINKDGGRDHWGACQSVLLAGGGVRGGRVHGASDARGEYPRDGKADPVDVHATLYHCLGIDPGQMIHDHLQRPHRLCDGRVIEAVL